MEKKIITVHFVKHQNTIQLASNNHNVQMHTSSVFNSLPSPCSASYHLPGYLVSEIKVGAGGATPPTIETESPGPISDPGVGVA